MRRLIFYTATLLAMIACSPAPEELARQTVETFIEAVCNQDMKTAKSIYNGCDFLNYVHNEIMLDKLQDHGEIILEHANDNKLEYTFATLYNGEKVHWHVNGSNNNYYRITKTNGLFRPDIQKIESKYGYKIEMNYAPADYADTKRKNKYNSCLQAINTFMTFANAVQKADTATIVKCFPAAAAYMNSIRLGGLLKAQKCEHLPNEIIRFYCGDTTFEIKSSQIIDCLNFISPNAQIAEVISVGTEAKSRGNLNDIAYIRTLQSQKNSILAERKRAQEEAERRAEEERAAAEERAAEARAEAEHRAYVAKFKAQGAGLVSHSFVSGNHDGKQTKGIKFRAANISDKVIKYISLEIVGYNSVDDPVWDGGYAQKVSGIGPLEPGCSGEWEFDNIWTQNPRIVDSYEIKSMTVIFKNGGSKTTKMPGLLPSNWRNILY